jgi:hypothetical protein
VQKPRQSILYYSQDLMEFSLNSALQLIDFTVRENFKLFYLLMPIHSYHKPLIPNLVAGFIIPPVQLLVLKERRYAIASPEAEQQPGK